MTSTPPPRSRGSTLSDWLHGTAVLYGVAATAALALGAISHDVFGRSLRVPLYYEGDALFYAAAFKGTLENGWYETNPWLNAPAGQSQHDFPQADNLQYVFARLFGFFTDNWALAFNLTYLLTFPLAAVTGLWFFRLVGCSRPSSLVMALLFAIAPYHYFHGISHLALSMYFVLPLGVGLCFRALTGSVILTRRSRPAGAHRFDPRNWLTRANLAVASMLVLLGSTSSYYAIFTLLLAAVTMLVLLLRRRWMVLLSFATLMGLLVVVMLLNMAPDMWYARTRSTNLTSFERLPIESEVFATKLSWLVLPTHWNRIGSLGEWRLDQDQTFPLPGEPTALGAVAAVGFLILLLLPVMRIAVPRLAHPPVRAGGAEVARHDALGALSVFNLVAFLFATVGGFATLVALLITPTVRSWGRLAILIGLLALAAIGLLLDALVDRQLRPRAVRLGRPLQAVALAAPAALVLCVGLADQLPSDAWTEPGNQQERFRSDTAFGAAVQQRVPAGGIVLQLPFMPFPENGPISDMGDYDPLRAYLNTTSVRWTYGGVKGSVRSSWSERLTSKPVDSWVLGAAGAGVDGVVVDRFGYPGHDSNSLERDLARSLDTTAVTSPDGRFAFYDMAPLQERLDRVLSPGERERMRRLVFASTGLVWPDDFKAPTLEGPLLVARSSTPDPVVQVDNPSRLPAEMAVRFTVRAEDVDSDTPIEITWPDDRVSRVLSPPGEGTAVTRTIRVPPGVSGIGFRADAGTSITLISPEFSDVTLARALRRAGKAVDESD